MSYPSSIARAKSQVSRGSRHSSSSTHLHAAGGKAGPCLHAEVAGDSHRQNSGGDCCSIHLRFSPLVVVHSHTHRALHRSWPDTDRWVARVLDWMVHARRARDRRTDRRTFHQLRDLRKSHAGALHHAWLAGAMSLGMGSRSRRLDTKEAPVSVQSVHLIGLKLQQNHKCRAVLHV